MNRQNKGVTMKKQIQYFFAVVGALLVCGGEVRGAEFGLPAIYEEMRKGVVKLREKE